MDTNVRKNFYNFCLSDKPEIEHVGPSREITSWLNHETTLTCKAAGFPLPEIKWSHDGAVEYSVQGYSCTSILRFTPRQASDFDVVVCMAKNILGSAEAKVTVKQLSKDTSSVFLMVKLKHITYYSLKTSIWYA